VVDSEIEGAPDDSFARCAVDAAPEIVAAKTNQRKLELGRTELAIQQTASPLLGLNSPIISPHVTGLATGVLTQRGISP
jgi:hypothetical protein